ncbi:hypothetical protein L195_g062454, partial [Trifolium pratense]
GSGFERGIEVRGEIFEGERSEVASVRVRVKAEDGFTGGRCSNGEFVGSVLRAEEKYEF